MTVSESDEDYVDDDGAPIDLSSLPPDLVESIPNLDRGQLIALQAYLEIHNHVGEFPLHLTIEALDRLVPGFAKETADEAIRDARDQRRRLNWAQAAEILQKALALIAGWGLAVFGALKGYEILSRESVDGQELLAAGLLMACCIGGPAGIAFLMRNSGVKLGVQTRLEDQ